MNECLVFKKKNYKYIYVYIYLTNFIKIFLTITEIRFHLKYIVRKFNNSKIQNYDKYLK